MHRSPPGNLEGRMPTPTDTQEWENQMRYQHQQQQQNYQNNSPPVASSRSPAGINSSSASGYPFPSPSGYPTAPSIMGSSGDNVSHDHNNAVHRALLDTAEANMDSLVSMVSDLGGWKPVLTHKSGAVVYRRTRVPPRGAEGASSVPIFMGVGVIKNVTPETIFTLVKSRSLWDEWYHEGHLVEKINDSTFLSYMVIRAISKAIASHRDLALLERREVDPVTGTIRVVSSSVETPKIPLVPTRIRANLRLNGWILDPQVSSDGRISTRVSYIIQSDVKGMVPTGLAKRYLARRALVVVWLDDYLRKYGPPPVHSGRSSLLPPGASSGSSINGYAGENSLGRYHQPESPRSYSPPQQYQQQYSPQPNYPNGSLNRSLEDEFTRRPSLDNLEDVAYKSDLIDADEEQNGFNSDDEGEAPNGFDMVDEDEPEVALAEAVNHRHVEAARKAVVLLKSLQSLDGWEPHSNADGISITTRPVEGSVMPMVRGDGVIEGPWSVLEVLSVVKSVTARLTWDPRFESGRIVESFNLDEALTHTQQRGTFPVSGRDLCCISKTAYDTDAIAEDAQVYQIATSVIDPAVPDDPKRVRAHLTLAGWILKKVEGGVKATYIVQVDIKGTIPSSLLKVIQAQTPRAIKEIQNYLSSQGPLAHLVRAIPHLQPTLNIRNPTETHDVSSRRLSTTFSWMHPKRYGGSVAFFLPAKHYAGGLDVDVTVRGAMDGAVVVTKAVQGNGLEWGRKVGDGVVVKVSVDRSVVTDSVEEVQVSIDLRPGHSGGVMVKGRPVADEIVPPHPKPVKAAPKPKPVAARVDTRTKANASSKSPRGPLSPTTTRKMPGRSASPPQSPVEPPSDPIPTPFPTPAPHRHTNALNAAFTLLDTLEPIDPWVAHSVSDGITITTLPHPTAPMPLVRGDGFIPSPYTLDEILATIRSPIARQIWDARFEMGRVVESFGVDESLAYSQQKGTFPVSGRELVTVVGVRREEEGVKLVVSSVEDGGVAEDPKRVRAWLTLGGWVLRKVEGGVQATYIVQIDIKGTIPSSLLKLLMAQTPKAIKDVHTYLAAHGPVPFIVRLPPSLRASPNIISASEEFVHGVKSFTASVTFKQPKTYGGVVFVFLPATLFPKDTAADVTVQGGKIDVGKVVDGIAESAGNGRVVRFLVDIKKVDDVDEMKITATFKPKSTASTSWSVTLNGSPVSEVDPTSTPAPVKPNKKTRTPPTSTTPPTTVTAKPPKPPAYIPHRHTESGVRALKLLKALYQDESMWTVETEDQRGVRISTIEVEGNQMPIVRGDAVFPSEWTPEDVVGVIRNVGARKIWDQRFDDGVIKEWLNPNEFVFQAWLKSNKPQGRERDVCGLQVTIYDSSTQTHYIMITSITDPLVPSDPRRLRSDVAVAGWIVRPKPRGGTSVTYIVKIDTRDENNTGAFPKIHAYLIALSVSEVLSYVETFGIPMNLKVLGNTGEGVRVTVMNERFEHGGVALYADYFVSSLGETVGTTGLAGMVEVNVDPRMCPKGVDVVFENDPAVEVKVSADKRVVRVYPKLDAVHAEGEIRVKMVVRARDPGSATREFTVNGEAVMMVDKAGKGAVAGSVRAKPIAAVASTKSIAAPTKHVTPAPAPAPIKPIIPVAKASPFPFPVPANPSVAPTSRSIPTAILFALFSLVLTILYPFIGGKQSSPKTPLDADTLLVETTPIQLTVVLAGGSVMSLAVLQVLLSSFAPASVAGVLGIVFSPVQWVLIVAVGTMSVYVGATLRK